MMERYGRLREIVAATALACEGIWGSGILMLFFLCQVFFECGCFDACCVVLFIFVIMIVWVEHAITTKSYSAFDFVTGHLITITSDAI